LTLYARGYRPYLGPRDATRFAFVPIQREGVRLATSGRAFRAFFLIAAAILVMFTVMLYVGETFGTRQAREVRVPGLRLDPEVAAAMVLENASTTMQSVLSWLGQILVLFVGAGLVADDLKSRSLPLYLVRPVTPFDYWLGKFLVPVRVLALTVLVPGLLLVLVGALFQPSDRMFPFLWDRRDLVSAVLLHFAYVAVVWSGVALLVSTVAPSRVLAIVIGAVVFFAGHVPREVAREASGTLGSLLGAASLHDDSRAFLALPLAGREDGLFVPAVLQDVPDTSWALAVGLAVFAISTFLVLRRARTVEVVA
jgi:hypothetical protein